MICEIILLGGFDVAAGILFMEGRALGRVRH